MSKREAAFDAINSERSYQDHLNPRTLWTSETAELIEQAKRDYAAYLATLSELGLRGVELEIETMRARDVGGNMSYFMGAVTARVQMPSKIDYSPKPPESKL